MSACQIAIAITIPCVVFVIALVWIIVYLKKHRYQKKLGENTKTIRTYIINLKLNEVLFFNHNKVKDTKFESLDQFYVQFASDDVMKLDAWIRSLLSEDSDIDPYFEIETFFNNSHKKYFTVLHATFVNKKDSIVHIDSHIFLHLSSRTKQNYRYRGISIDEVAKQLEISSTLRGISFNFRFSYRNKNSVITGVDRLLFNELKEIALYYAVPPQRFLVETNKSEFIVFDFKSSELGDTIKYIHTIVSHMNRFLEINSLIDSVIISIGVVKNKYFPNNAKAIASKAHEMSNIAFEKDKLIVSYMAELFSSDKANYTTEIQTAVRDSAMKFLYSPIIDIRHERVFGYLSSVELKNKSKSLEDLFARSIKREEYRELLVSINDGIREKFVKMNKERNAILFIDLKLKDTLDSLKVNYANYNDKENKIALTFDEYDVSHFVITNTFDGLVDLISKIKSKKINVALKLSDSNLIMNNNVYRLFDYFIVTFDVENIREALSYNIAYRIIVEKLLKFNRPIILSHADSWSAVELLIRSGIDYISGEALGETSGDKLTAPTNKNYIKIRRILDS